MTDLISDQIIYIDCLRFSLLNTRTLFTLERWGTSVIDGIVDEIIENNNNQLTPSFWLRK